jgi:hypothetical protein
MFFRWGWTGELAVRFSLVSQDTHATAPIMNERNSCGQFLPPVCRSITLSFNNHHGSGIAKAVGSILDEEAGYRRDWFGE